MGELSQSSPGGFGGQEVAPGVFVEAGGMRFQFARSGGPGGQNVNKLNTKAEVWVAISALRGMREDAIRRLREMAGSRLTAEDEIHIVAQTSRTQEANRAAVLQKLRELLVRAMHRPKIRRKTRPTAGSRRRRIENKRRRGEIKSQRSQIGE